MGKIVKFCSSCDENFAEKFGFCPNCGATLTAFEMNPVAKEAAEPPAPAVIEPEAVSEPAVEAAPVEEVAEPVVESKKAAAVAAPVFFQTKPMDADAIPASLEDEHAAHAREGDFYVTVIEEKNVATRNGLLLGTFGLMIVAVFASLVVNIFGKDLNVGAIGDDMFLASLLDEIPMDIQEELKKDKDDGGGGGGGGRDEEEETTQGDLADQSEKPTRAPDAKVPRMDSELKLETPTTQGNQTFEKKFDRWGDPNGRFANFSNGTGSGGGQGSGYGTGQGSGRGTGTGSGIGSGSGSGNGSGNGSGTGIGGEGEPPPRPPRVSTALAIISKPKAMFTEDARKAGYTGSVTLRVTFLASGQIGSISTISGLPHGLTESAIAAARRIQFKPAMVDGVPQTVSKPVQYVFTLY